jgi:hypothetical protein
MFQTEAAAVWWWSYRIRDSRLEKALRNYSNVASPWQSWLVVKADLVLFVFCGFIRASLSSEERVVRIAIFADNPKFRLYLLPSSCGCLLALCSLSRLLSNLIYMTRKTSPIPRFLFLLETLSQRCWFASLSLTRCNLQISFLISLITWVGADWCVWLACVCKLKTHVKFWAVNEVFQ